MKQGLLRIIFIAAVALACITAHAQSIKEVGEGETIFTYAPDGNDNYYAATGTLSMAIHIDDTSLVGAQVVGLRFSLTSPFLDVNSVTGWTSTALTLSSGANQPSGEVAAYDDAAVSGWNEIRFDNPVVIPAEGIYVGYTMTSGGFFTGIGVGSNYVGDGCCYVYQQGSYDAWTDVNLLSMPALSMQAIVAGMNNTGVTIELGDFVIAKPNEAGNCTATVYNYTQSTISSLQLAYEVAGTSGNIDVAPNIISNYGSSATFTFDVPAIAEAGQYDMTISVGQVNGADYTDTPAIGTSLYIVSESEVKHRAVMEEYSGTWCGYCPYGIVAMSRLRNSYPDDFIGLVYHDSDPMDASHVAEPQAVSTYPSCYIDRAGSGLHPYYGTSDEPMGIEQDWLARCAVSSPVAIEVAAELSDDETVVNVTSSVEFLYSTSNGDYTIAYALLADGLTGSDDEVPAGYTWTQHNYFNGSTIYSGDEWAVFTAGGNYVAIDYDDVVILAPDILGVEGSIPAQITAYEPIAHTYAFTLGDATGVRLGQSLVQDLGKLRVVAMVLNSRGEIVNAGVASVPYNNSSVDNIGTASDVVEVARYSLDGRRLTTPERGVNIVKMSDGTARKIIVK